GLGFLDAVPRCPQGCLSCQLGRHGTSAGNPKDDQGKQNSMKHKGSFELNRSSMRHHKRMPYLMQTVCSLREWELRVTNNMKASLNQPGTIGCTPILFASDLVIGRNSVKLTPVCSLVLNRSDANMSASGWKELVGGFPWFEGEGKFPIAAYSEFMPPPRI